MSANAEALHRSGIIGSRAQEQTIRQAGLLREPSDWDPEDFAREQIRGLVQRVFFSSGPPVRQVVFSSVDPNTDVGSICDRVGQALALETRADVAVVSCERREEAGIKDKPTHHEVASIKTWATQVAINLWQVPGFHSHPYIEPAGTGSFWISRCAELRNEFEYVVIRGPEAGISHQAALLGHVTDGIILVIGAHSTRKATARTIKQTLEGTQSRILGTVLSGRRFPVPERIYRQL
jgi:hypothetical protein